MARNGAVHAFIGLAFMVSALSGGATAATHIVGGDVGWTLPGSPHGFNYTTWAAQQTFTVGDILDFQYDAAAHNVQPLPSKESFAACNISAAAIGTASQSGSTNIALKTPGTKWYVCGLGTHCQHGMKFKIDVSPAVAAPAPAPGGSAQTGAAPSISVGHGSTLAIVATALLLALFH